MRAARGARGLSVAILIGLVAQATAAEMPWIRVAEDQRGFVTSTGKPFTPWGVNYDHDPTGRLIEDYWDSEWSLVEQHFATIKSLKANVVRVHLQFGRFMQDPATPRAAAHRSLLRLLQLAESTGLYLDLTGLGCYHKADVPDWYDALSEEERWKAQAVFWTSVAETCANSPAIFCYDLMNEPVVPGGRRKPGDWLGPAFAGKHFVQCIALDQQQRPRPQIAAEWVRTLSAAIRRVDQRHLVTVGLVDWSLDRPGLTSGFTPGAIKEHVDFLCVHLYPESGKLDVAQETLAGFAVGKPVVIEETFPLKCSTSELSDFIRDSRKSACGWISFYWGESLEELRKSKEMRDALVMQWLDEFQKLESFMVP